jgi:hypothetical protein
MRRKYRQPFTDLGDGTAYIDLGDGSVCRVDLADAAWLDQWKWYAWRSSAYKNKIYAVRGIQENGRSRLLSMHRLLLGLEFGDAREGDHLNFDGLDNRRANLRAVTKLQNSQHRQKGRGGVYFDSSGRNWTKPWRAQARLGGTKFYVGRFATQDEALAAVRAWWTARGLPLDIALTPK